MRQTTKSTLIRAKGTATSKISLENFCTSETHYGWGVYNAPPAFHIPTTYLLFSASSPGLSGGSSLLAMGVLSPPDFGSAPPD